MGNHTRKLFPLFSGLIACVIFVFCFVTAAHAAEIRKRPYRILVINSYDYSFSTVPQHLGGFSEGLGDLYTEVTYEFMDAKRVFSESSTADFYSYLSNKLNHTARYDLVVLVDDTALHFGTNYAQDLFPDTPIVFMGVNNVAEAERAAANDHVTGIAEVFDIEGNIALSSKLFPSRGRYVVITDKTNSAVGEYIEFARYAGTHPELDYRTIDMSEYNQNEFAEALSNVGEDSIIIYLDCLRDGGRNIYTLEDAVNLIRECAPDVPIWRMSVVSGASGIFGGITYSYEDAGRMAGETAARILTGTSPSDIPMITDASYQSYFDQNELDHYHIGIHSLPEDAIILHEHKNFATFYRDNKLLVNLVMLTAVLMVAIIVLLIHSNRRNRNLVRQDFLTKMPNRIYITEKIASITESGEAFGLVMIDVDKFKTINDTLGHLVGDELLMGVARRLKSLVARDVFLARIGGDEFMGLIRKADKDKADHICKEIVRIMKDDFESSAGPLHITVSVGCAVYPLDTDSAASVMALADEALYDIKEHGRDGYRLYCDLK